VNPTQGEEFSRLTLLGQLYYADRRCEGADHEQAMVDAVYSYGWAR
jgi:hypothetical protein